MNRHFVFCSWGCCYVVVIDAKLLFSCGAGGSTCRTTETIAAVDVGFCKAEILSNDCCVSEFIQFNKHNLLSSQTFEALERT